jgi:hypothetical protein
MSVELGRRQFLKAFAALAGAAALPAEAIEQLARAPAHTTLSIKTRSRYGFTVEQIVAGDFYLDFGDFPLMVDRDQDLEIRVVDQVLEVYTRGLVIARLPRETARAIARLNGVEQLVTGEVDPRRDQLWIQGRRLELDRDGLLRPVRVLYAMR